jgi:hypothetical protein
VVSLCSGRLAAPECGVSRIIPVSVFLQIQFRGTEMKVAKIFVVLQIPKLLVCLFHISAVSYSVTRI